MQSHTRKSYTTINIERMYDIENINIVVQEYKEMTNLHAKR